MKTRHLVLSVLMATRLVSAGTPEIDIEVRFIEIGETAPAPAGMSWQLDDSGISPLVAGNVTNWLSVLTHSGTADLLSAPRVRTKSGTNATIKVVTEYRYPTGVEVQSVSVTNGTSITRGIAIVPSNFQTRDVGVTLSVTPIFDAKQDMIHLNLMAEVVTEPTWKEFTATYEGTDGTQKTVSIPQPFFHTRQVTPRISLHNGSTVVMGGLITTGTKRIEDRIPVLGAIPWLGRLFRSSKEIAEKRHLLIVVTAKTVG